MNINWIFMQITAPGAVADSAGKAAMNDPAGLTAPAEEVSLSLFDLLMKGGLVMIPIGLLSLLAVYVLIERLVAIRKASRFDPNFMNSVRDFVLGGNIDAARSLCRNTPGPQGKMIEKGISRIGKPIREIEDAIENVGKLEVYKLERNLSVLSIVGRVAPMLGFIGTILGVIKIFYNISLADSFSIGRISEGLYEKMITSAGGLVVGVIAFAAYHWLQMRIDRIVNRMESDAIEFIDLIQEPVKNKV